MPARSSRKANRDTSTDGHSLAYYRNSFTERDPASGPRNRRGGGAARPVPPVIRSIPAGTLMLFVGGSNPDTDNYAVADGSAISRTTYGDLFSVTGTTYGSGDGSTTFNLPDLSGQTIRHNSTPGVETTYSAPTHTHGALRIANGFGTSGNSADANNTVRGTVNNVKTSNAGGVTHKFRDHDVLPLVSLKECQLPVGALLYTFRDLNQAREYCTCIPANGSTYSSSTYPDLYTVTSTSYGGSAASPNRPDFRGCFPKCNKTYTPGNNYSTDSFPQHQHGPWTGSDQNASTFSTRQDGPSGAGGLSANGTTNSAGVGNANEMRGNNVAAHAIIVASNSTTEVPGLGVFNTNAVEPGDIIFYLGTGSPTGYKTLNGGDPLSATDNPTLATVLEANFVSGDDIDCLNCDNRYLRGVDSGVSRDPDAASRTFGGTGNTNGANVCGTFQSECLTAHTHTHYTQINNSGQNQYPNYNNVAYRFQSGADLNSYGLIYNTNVSTNTSDVRVPDLKVNMCMALG